MIEREPGRSSGSPERMNRTADKYQSWIVEGITAAQAEQREIDLMTARLIAHALGRALGRTSALADFGRTGEGAYEALRDEYLPLYADPSTPPMIREWIDWFGTYLVQRENTGSSRRFMNQHQPPSLDRLLVETAVAVEDSFRLLHLPASTSLESEREIAARLHAMPESRERAFWAFLSLPDVDASSSTLTQSYQDNYVGEFESIEKALYGLVELEEWETDLRRFAAERGLLAEAVSIDLDVIENQTREVYDLIELDGTIYAFIK